MTITHFSNAHIFDGETPDLKTDCYVEVSVNKITYIGREKPDSHCDQAFDCLLYTSPSPRDRTRSRMPSSA